MLKNLVKLYVRDNQVQSLQNIDSAPKLTHLYIINNDISELDSVARNELTDIGEHHTV